MIDIIHVLGASGAGTSHLGRTLEEKYGYKWEDNPYVFVYEFERIEKQ